MTIEMNLFAENYLMKGALAYTSVANAMTVRTNSGSSTDYFTPGMAVKLIDSTSKEIVVDEATGTDSVYGFVVYQAKNPNTVAKGEHVVIAKRDDIMVMEAGAAIVVGAKVEIAANQKVITSAGTNTIVGLCLEKAAADEDLIKVEILSPLFSQV